jgi:hypothetical protein
MKAKSNIALLFVLLLFNNRIYSQCGASAGVPYYEGFTSLLSNNQLPTCWSASNLGGSNVTFTQSSGYAGFFSNPPSTSYFYSKSISLKAGVLYSLSLWVKSDVSSNSNWSNFSIFTSTIQGNTSLSPVASTSIFNTTYSLLSNTFTIPADGAYYIVVSAISTGTSSSQYLYWDDLSVTIPCTVSPNSPTITVSATSNTMCAGSSSQPTLYASGAHTYTWITGAHTSSVVYTYSAPTGNMQVFVAGTNSLTGCASTGSLMMTLYPKPNIYVLAKPIIICDGNNSTLTAVGAFTYSWSAAGTGNSITVSPTSTSNYTVTGFNSNGCSSQATVSVNVMARPVLTLSSSQSTICANESVTLQASGAYSYTWTSNPPGQILITQPASTTIFSVVGESFPECTSSATIQVYVDQCTGIENQIFSTRPFSVYENANGINIHNFQDALLEFRIFNSSGAIVIKGRIFSGKVVIPSSELPNGLYYLHGESSQGCNTIKFIKTPGG